MLMTAKGSAGVEKVGVRIVGDARSLAVTVAEEIAQLIRSRAAEGKHAVLGLPTGSTPTGVYAELVRMHKQQGLSFRNVITFNLDEYYPMEPDALQSYVRFMREHLFDHVDISPENVHIPDGTTPLHHIGDFCKNYEQAIRDASGLDIQLLGIGRSGHIGFNEPGSSDQCRTRLITLDRITRLDAASDFFGEENVPRRGVTMGVGTILDARRLILIAFGEMKAPMIARAIEGPVTSALPASYLQTHPNAEFFLDDAAAAMLTRMQAPWVQGPAVWEKCDDRAVRKAVIWLSRELKKPILHLTDEDYNEAGLQDLLALRGPAYEINIDVFRALHETITGWPGGKPSHLKRAGDIDRPGDQIFPKRVVVFSPHPDDDAISMGGTLIRLADQGHEVHVAYQTSGNIAVFDYDVLRFLDFVQEMHEMLNVGADARAIQQEVQRTIRQRKPGQVDSKQLQTIKGLIRRGEARAAGQASGVPVDRLHFLDLPFYETGTIRKRPIGEEDICIVQNLLMQIRPQQIYAAGDLTDPHGTHRVCLEAVMGAIKRVQNESWFADCEVWLYRGAWQEWEPERIDMAVPLSPTELVRKRNAIFRHQSQKDRAMYPGDDQREFWQRAEDRNRATARIYDELGLAQYAAMEGFVRWTPKTPS